MPTCIICLSVSLLLVLPPCRVAGVTGWSSILRTLLVHQQHWQSLGMMNFIELAGPIPSEEEWEHDHEDDLEDDHEDVFEGRGEDEDEYELQEGELAEPVGEYPCTVAVSLHGCW